MHSLFAICQEFTSKPFCINRGFGVIAVLASTLCAAPTVYKDLQPQYNSRTSTIMLRQVDVPTRAALDLAAWYDNSLFATPGQMDSATNNITTLVALNGLVDPNRIARVEVDLAKTGLTPKDFQSTLSYPALKRACAMELHWDSLARVQEVVAKAQGLQAVRVVLQGSEAIWVELEVQKGFMVPNAKKNIYGTQVIYVQLAKSLVQQGLPAFNKWKDLYVNQKLDSARVLEWAQVLASYWYPSLNTDLVWDLPKNEPTIVIRGNPLGIPHFTKLSVKGLGPVAQRGGSATVAGTIANKMADRSLPQNFVQNNERIAAELNAHGGSFNAWDSSLIQLHKRWQHLLDSVPATQMGLEGKRNWLFFRRSLLASIAGDLSAQKPGVAPIAPLIDFKGRLEANEVNMLFIPVPTKEEIMPELVPGGDSSLIGKIVHPYGRKFILDAQEEGMEIVDLLPPLLAERAADAKAAEPLFQKDDTHWTRRGMLVAAQVIADRIKQYSWYNEAKPDTKRFTMRDTIFTRLGDIVERMPESKQSVYPAATLACSRVYANGVPYAGPKGAPIILVGDSFTGVMESVDCRNGGLGAHIARLTGLDVEVITSWGGGPNVRQKLLQARKAQLAQARLVIYVMTARDLYQYPDGWDELAQ